MKSERIESPEQRSSRNVKPVPQSKSFHIAEPEINIEEPVNIMNRQLEIK